MNVGPTSGKLARDFSKGYHRFVKIYEGLIEMVMVESMQLYNADKTP